MSATLDASTIPAQVQTLRNMHFRLSGRFLATFAAVPDERLHWRAADSAKTAFEIACHVAAAHRFFLAGLSGEDVPHDFPGAMKWIDDRASKYAGREEVASCLSESRLLVDKVYESGINYQAYAASDDYQFLVRLPAFHTETHAGQIDYLQTCWGDMQMHFAPPPSEA